LCNTVHAKIFNEVSNYQGVMENKKLRAIYPLKSIYNLYTQNKGDPKSE
jgi:hypothetical protein